MTRRRSVDTNPAAAFPLAASACGDLVWLDSAIGLPGRGRGSTLCLELEPALAVGGAASTATLTSAEGQVQQLDLREFWDRADALFAAESATAAPGLGWCGYVAYEAGWLADDGLPESVAEVPFPVIRFDRVRAALVETSAGCELIATGATAPDAEAVLDRWEDRLVESSALPEPEALVLEARIDGDRHTTAVATIRDRIAEGRVYQACYTFPLRFGRPDSLAPHYIRLRAVSPGDFGGFVRMGDLEAASTSPERFFRVSGRTVECRPMKGTRPRGTTPEDDERAASELAASEKDRAENVMIVDLMRNDIGRVCEVGQVKVASLYEVESYATVHQMTSTVIGTLRENVGPFGVLRATFPPGSMTGAPKVAACRLLHELEYGPRGLYSGSIGWLGYDGVSEFSVVIRTLQAWEDHASWNVGGGVVWDSTPDGELAEAITKAAALERAGLLDDNVLV